MAGKLHPPYYEKHVLPREERGLNDVQIASEISELEDDEGKLEFPLFDVADVVTLRTEHETREADDVLTRADDKRRSDLWYWWDEQYDLFISPALDDPNQNVDTIAQTVKDGL